MRHTLHMMLAFCAYYIYVSLQQLVTLQQTPNVGTQMLLSLQLLSDDQKS